MEIVLELTKQEDADKVAFVLEQVVARWGLDREEKELFTGVAVVFRNATRDTAARNAERSAQVDHWS